MVINIRGREEYSYRVYTLPLITLITPIVAILLHARNVRKILLLENGMIHQLRRARIPTTLRTTFLEKLEISMNALWGRDWEKCPSVRFSLIIDGGREFSEQPPLL